MAGVTVQVLSSPSPRFAGCDAGRFAAALAGAYANGVATTLEYTPDLSASKLDILAAVSKHQDVDGQRKLTKTVASSRQAVLSSESSDAHGCSPLNQRSDEKVDVTGDEIGESDFLKQDAVAAPETERDEDAVFGI